MSLSPERQRESEAREFYSGAQRRALVAGIVMAVAGTVIAGLRWDRYLALGFALGAVVGGANALLSWRASAAFTRRAVRALDPEASHGAPGAGRLLFQSLARYVVVALAIAYVIFKATVFSVLGFFSGLFLPVAALMVEAIYEAWVSYRKGL